jgi:hypothetical protein
MFSNVTLLFFVLLIPLAGFIAWAGDNIGHRTGKRRHSLFGLRPRHTALIFTIASGMAIALVSFGVFWLFSESFRTIVQEGEALFITNQSLKKDNRLQAEELANSRARLTALRAEAERFNTQRLEAETARNTAIQQRTEAHKAQKIAEEKREEAERRSAEAQKNYQKATRSLAEAQKDLTQVRRSLKNTEGDLKGARRELGEKNERVRQAESRLVTAEQQVKDAEERVVRAKEVQRKAESEAALAKDRTARVTRTAEDALTFQREQLDDLRKTITAQNRQYADLAAKTEEQRLELARINRELSKRRDEYDTLVSNTAALRGKQITYEVGEEVDRLPISAGTSVWRIQYMLETFMTTASKKAERRGAARGKQERAVLIVPEILRSQEASLTSGPRIRTEEDVLSMLANEIRAKNADMLVVANAVANAVAGEPVAVILRIYQNPVVFKKDARIGEILLNGEKSRQELADALYAFLSHEIQQRLLQAGMVAPSRNTLTGELDFSLSGEEWFRVMDEVRKAGLRPQVIVHAAKDLRAGDPVELRLSVRQTVPWAAPPEEKDGRLPR